MEVADIANKTPTAVHRVNKKNERREEETRTLFYKVLHVSQRGCRGGMENEDGVRVWRKREEDGFFSHDLGTGPVW
jgi:hypothetical protein